MPFSLSDLKIAFVAGTLGQGGAERQLFHILSCLHASGASVRLLSLTAGEFWEEEIRKLGIPVVWVGQSPARLSRLRRIVQELRSDPPILIQSQHFYTNLYVAAAGRILGIPDAGAARNDVISEIQSNGRILGNLSLWAPSVIIANSRRGIRNASAKMGSSHLYFLGNVVDSDIFRPSSARSTGTVRLLGVGRMVQFKRFDRFLRIFAQIRQQAGVDIRATLVGDGPLRPELERLAAGLSLDSSVVQFRGAIRNPEELANVYRDSDIFALTSDYEGTPNVVLEAMASGLPVVATNVGGVDDLIQDEENGFLTGAADEQWFAGQIIRLAKDPSLRHEVGSNARRFVEARHSLGSLSGRLESLYARLLHPGKRSSRTVTGSAAASGK